jgi:hypothetical protein
MLTNPFKRPAPATPAASQPLNESTLCHKERRLVQRPLPLPEVEEDNSDEAWALWNEASQAKTSDKP